MLNRERILPVFYATDVSRIPSVDMKYCDISVILTQVIALGAGWIKDLKEEVAVLPDVTAATIPAADDTDTQDPDCQEQQDSNKSKGYATVLMYSRQRCNI